MYPWTYSIPQTNSFLMSQKVPSESNEQVSTGGLFSFQTGSVGRVS